MLIFSRPPTAALVPPHPLRCSPLAPTQSSSCQFPAQLFFSSPPTSHHTRREGPNKASPMALLSGLFHESEASTRASEERRYEKYGGEQKIDTMVDLSEETLPGVLMKKIVRPGNGELPPVGSNVSRGPSSSCVIVIFMLAV